MKRRRRQDPVPSPRNYRGVSLTVSAIFCLLVLAAPFAHAVNVLQIKQDDSKVMTFDRMKRVWVTNPEIIDVVVSSYNELLLYSKNVGRTKLYVWDARGRHEYSVEVTRLPSPEQVLRELSSLLGRSFTYTIVDDSTILVEGEVATEAEKNRVNRIVTTKSEGLKVLELVTVREVKVTPAEEHRRAFEKLFPQQFRYSTIDDKTLVVEGEVGTAAEKRRVEKILAAATAISVVDLVKSLEGLDTPEAQRIESIKKAIGPDYEYLELEGSILVVSGQAPSERERERIDKIINAAKGDITVVNVVTLESDTRSPAQLYAERLKPLFSAAYTFTPLGENGLVAEGVAASPLEAKRVDEVLKLLEGEVQVVNLISTTPQDPAEKAVAVLRNGLGEAYQVRSLGENIVLVEGIAAGEAEARRVDALVAAAPKTVTVVNAVTRSGLTSSTGLARKYEQALRPILGEGLTYTTLDDGTLLVEGTVATAGERERIGRILASLDGTVKVLDLVTTPAVANAASKSPAERAVMMLKEALGDAYTVRTVAEDVVLVEGTAPGQAELDRVELVINASPEGARVVNLVTTDGGGSVAARYEMALKEVLGEQLTYRAIDDKTLLIEGYVKNAGEKERASKVIASLAGGLTILDLIAIQPGPDAMAQSEASRKAELISQLLGERYSARAVDEKTIVVAGTAPGQSEQQRLGNLLQQIAGDFTLVNMILAQDDADTRSPADRLIVGLKQAVPENLKLVALDDQTVLIEGIVPTSIEREQVEKIATAMSKSGGVSVVSLVLSEMQAKTPAARRIEHLKRILGDKYNYIVWDEDTVLVEGTVDNEAELEKVRKILEAADKDFKVGDVVTYGQGGAAGMAEETTKQLAQTIAQAVGEPYNVWMLKPGKVVVEGVAPDEAAMSRLNTLLQAWAEEVSVINLATVAPTPTVPLVARAESLRALLGELYQVRSLQGKAIVVEATVPTESEATRARAIMAAMGTDVPLVDLVTVADPAKRQVLAHVKVLDINRGFLKQVGINWGQLTGETGEFTFADQPFLVKVQEGVDFINTLGVNVSALKQGDVARILAEPNLVVNEGESANMVVGGEVPIPVPQLGTGATSITVQYKEYGVVLRLKPEIMPDGKSLRLEVEPEVSSIDPATQVSIGGISIPAFRTRKAKTVVNMPDGATLVIGGLLQHDQTRVVREIPVLSKLPIIGELFKSKEWRQGFSELVILVTPEILHTVKPEHAEPASN
ncbi:MAG: pilus assembly protein N-terminal domain-containing protein [Acidobacteriota bacterium]|nr:pilus assembly protein N-terminal domain-containing protein [Acidobacteriota bacterium]